MLFIFVGSSIPGEEFPQYEGAWDFVVKKSGHLLEYGLLAVLLLSGVANRVLEWRGDDQPLPTRQQFVTALALTVLYAASDEFHQRFTPGRGPHLLDVAIDLLGAGLGLALFYAWHLIRQTRSQSSRSPSTRPQP